MCGILNAREADILLWNIERTVTRIYIPVLLTQSMGDRGCKDLLTKVVLTVKSLKKCITHFDCRSKRSYCLV